jgi:hypothetical protein
MSIRIRKVDGVLVACCAARTVPQHGDIYLDDAVHHALAAKFMEDFASEGYNTKVLDAREAALRAKAESNNPAREWWNTVYDTCPKCGVMNPCFAHPVTQEQT